MHFGILDNYSLYEHLTDACFSSHFVESDKFWVKDNISGYAKQFKEWIW